MSDYKLRFDRTLEVLALVWAETMNELANAKAERSEYKRRMRLLAAKRLG